MSVTSRTRPSGRDPFAHGHRRASLPRGTFFVAAVLILLGGGTWLMFASSVFAVMDVTVAGVATNVAEQMRAAVEETLGQRTLGFLRPARNILLLDTDAVAASLRSSFPNLASVSVVKTYPHAVHITAEERIPVGVWCRGDSCRYFDWSGARWGNALPSRGPLLLLVADERADDAWDERLFSGLRIAAAELPRMGLRPATVVLPDAAPGDVRITVAAGYDVIMNAVGDVSDQLGTLEVLVAEKAKDTAFGPSYIDIRTPGRVYYR